MICRNCGQPIFGGKGDYFHSKPGNPTHCEARTAGMPDPHGTLTALPLDGKHYMISAKEEGVTDEEFKAYRDRLARKYRK